MKNWQEVALDQVAVINPTETLPKNSLDKKVAREDLQPFKKRPTSFNFDKYNGGMKIKNGDTVIARITPCLENGKTAYIDFLDSDEIGFGSTEYIVLRQKEGLSDSQFLYYFAISDYFREIAILSMTGSSGRQRVQTDVVRQHRFMLPPLQEQKAIASVLSCLDDKIDLLHRQNKTLEVMGETLFRQWFVEDAQGNWTDCSISDFANHAKENVKPQNHSDTLFSHYSIPAFDNERRPTIELGREILSNKFKVLPYSILVSKLNPRTPRIWPIC